MTGGFAGRRCAGVSAGVSSGQTSPRSSDISTNSNARIFFTAFGASMAAGLYGPGAWRCLRGSVDGLPDFGSCTAAAASRSRPDVPGGGPPVGVNVGSGGRLAGSGWSPSASLTLPVESKGGLSV